MKDEYYLSDEQISKIQSCFCECVGECLESIRNDSDFKQDPVEFLNGEINRACVEVMDWRVDVCPSDYVSDIVDDILRAELLKQNNDKVAYNMAVLGK